MKPCRILSLKEFRGILQILLLSWILWSLLYNLSCAELQTHLYSACSTLLIKKSNQTAQVVSQGPDNFIFFFYFVYEFKMILHVLFFFNGTMLCGLARSCYLFSFLPPPPRLAEEAAWPVFFEHASLHPNSISLIKIVKNSCRTKRYQNIRRGHEQSQPLQYPRN